MRRLGSSAQAVQLSAVLHAPRAGNNFTTDVVLRHRIIDNQGARCTPQADNPRPSRTMAGGSSFVYAIATRWAVDWVVKQSPKRWSKRTAIYIAIAVLVAALSPALYEHITARGENYYQLLQVPVESTAKEIKSAYRRASLLYHPDKLGHLDEEELEAANVKFQTIRDAYEALMHQTTKVWGAAGHMVAICCCAYVVVHSVLQTVGVR